MRRRCASAGRTKSPSSCLPFRTGAPCRRCCGARAAPPSSRNGAKVPHREDCSMDSYNKDELNRRMNGAVATLKTELAGLRTGRASPALLEPVKAEAYGNPMPISQLGTVRSEEHTSELQSRFGISN